MYYSTLVGAVSSGEGVSVGVGGDREGGIGLNN